MDNLPPLIIGYIKGIGWELTELDSPQGTKYTPQAFEAEYGYLPNIPGNISKSLKKIPEYYAHRKASTSTRGKGFG